MRHLEALTGGLSRRAAIQRTLLPVMLGWFADEADPDAGLLAFRQISDSLGSSHWYLRMLRDEGSAAERLAHVLARSRYAADLLIRAPESVAMLGDAGGLTPRSREKLLSTMRAAIRRKTTADDAITAARVVRRQELFRIAVADLTGQLDLAGVGRALTDLTCAILQSALEIATRGVEGDLGGPLGTDLLVMGMGSLGGARWGTAQMPMSCSSIAPTQAWTRPKHSSRPRWSSRRSGACSEVPARSQLVIDTDLRPEGRAGRWFVLWPVSRRTTSAGPDLGGAGTDPGRAGRRRRRSRPGLR